MIAGEGSPRAVGTVHAGRQADQNNTRRRIAERRHRPAVVLGLPDVHGIQKSRQTRTAPAIGVKNRTHTAKMYHNAGLMIRWAPPSAQKKRATRITRSPPSIALGLWTNPSATEPEAR